MAGAGVAGPVETSLFVAVAGAGDRAYATIHALATDGNAIQDTIDIGDQEQSGNPLTYTPYGEGTTKSIPGPATLGDFAFGMVIDYKNAHHLILAALAVGTVVTALIKQESDGTTYTVIEGRIGSQSRRTPAGAPNQRVLTISMSRAPYEVHDPN